MCVNLREVQRRGGTWVNEYLHDAFVRAVYVGVGGCGCTWVNEYLHDAFVRAVYVGVGGCGCVYLEEGRHRTGGGQREVHQVGGGVQGGRVEAPHCVCVCVCVCACNCMWVRASACEYVRARFS